MFTEENITIAPYLDKGSNIESPLFDHTDYKKQTSELCGLVNQIIDELQIQHPIELHIKPFLFFEEVDGSENTCVKNGSIVSKIELSRKVYNGFNSKENEELKKKSLATIYHEMYHVKDYEIVIPIINNHINTPDKYLLLLGIHYWCEFNAYRKTMNIHMTDYAINKYNDIYDNISRKKPNFNDVKNFFYMLSLIAAYSTDENFISKMNNDTWFNLIENTQNIEHLFNLFNSMNHTYPESMTYKNLIEIGWAFQHIIEDRGYTLKSDDNNIEVIEYNRLNFGNRI